MNRFLLLPFLILHACLMMAQQTSEIDSIKVYRLPSSIVCMKIRQEAEDIRTSNANMFSTPLLVKRIIVDTNAILSFDSLLKQGRKFYHCEEESCLDARAVIDIYNNAEIETIVADRRGCYEVLGGNMTYHRSQLLLEWLDKYIPEAIINMPDIKR